MKPSCEATRSSLPLPARLTSAAEAWPTVRVDCSRVDLASPAGGAAAREALLRALRRAHAGAVSGQALVKVHVGEPSCATRMRPGFAAPCAAFARERGASGVAAGDTTVAYTGPRGHRQNPAGGAAKYLELARAHGWSEDGPAGRPFVVLDRPTTSVRGVFEFEAQRKLAHVEGVMRFRDFHLAGGFAAAGFVANNAHLTLHGLAGVAGCVKSIAMGCASLAGKLRMHQALLPRFDAGLCSACARCVANCPEGALTPEEGRPTPTVWPDDCIGCGECVALCERGAVRLEGEDIHDWRRGEDTLAARMTDYTMGLMHGRWESTVHVLHMYAVTRLCDCVDVEQERMLEGDLGFLVGKNPFAVDALAAGLLARAAEEEGKSLPASALESARKAAEYAEATYGVLAQAPVETLEVT